jgi:hypothetical protein
VLQFDPSSPNILNLFYVGDEALFKLRRPFWTELQSRFGNMFYVREQVRGLRGAARGVRALCMVLATGVGRASAPCEQYLGTHVDSSSSSYSKDCTAPVHVPCSLRLCVHAWWLPLRPHRCCRAPCAAGRAGRCGGHPQRADLLPGQGGGLQVGGRGAGSTRLCLQSWHASVLGCSSTMPCTYVCCC